MHDGMSLNVMHTEKVIYTQACELPANEAPVFITAAVMDPRRQLVTQESHVFLPRDDIYLHKINYINNSGADFDSLIVGAIRNTHRLHADHMAAHAASRRPVFNHLQSFDADLLATHPFHRFRLENKFLEQMWEIQEWTASRELRLALAQVIRYKTDRDEAELISRIFTSGAPSTTQERSGLQLGHGRRIDPGF